jgi:ketosteroid isomerase-like protein
VNHSLEEIMHVEQQLQQAMVKDDVQALRRLLHDDLVFTDFTGTVVGKHEDLDGHASGSMQITELEFVETPVTRLYGETAVVTVKAHVKGIYQGTPSAGFYRYLRVWLFQEERWQVVAGNISVVSA